MDCMICYSLAVTSFFLLVLFFLFSFHFFKCSTQCIFTLLNRARLIRRHQYPVHAENIVRCPGRGVWDYRPLSLEPEDLGVLGISYIDGMEGY